MPAWRADVERTCFMLRMDRILRLREVYVEALTGLVRRCRSMHQVEDGFAGGRVAMVVSTADAGE